MRVGILGLQGGFALHKRAVETCGASTLIVRQPKQLNEIDSLIIPGGESTTIIRAMDAFGFWEPLKSFINSYKPTFGTCAGAIILAQTVTHPAQRSLGAIDVTVERNGYGPQTESAEHYGTFRPNFDDVTIPMIFIRAPKFSHIGPHVQLLGRCAGEHVIVRENNVLACSFHPELTEVLCLHHYFLEMKGSIIKSY